MSNEQVEFNLPGPIRDFLFDLHDSVCRSRISEEVQRLYEVKYKEVTDKYFSSSAWPDIKVVAPHVYNDEFFLTLYRLDLSLSLVYFLFYILIILSIICFPIVRWPPDM